MDRSGAVPLMIMCAILVGVGIALLWFAPHIQRVGLRMMGEPRNSLAVWSHRLAASRTSLRSIRATGAMCIAAGAVLVALLATR
jgi:hypothetical protein